MFFLNMLTLSSILYILVMAEFVLGNFFNVFIVLVNCFDWVRKQKISLGDQIFTALGFSRIGLLSSTLTHWFVFNSALYSLEERLFVHITCILFNHFSTWLTTCLSIFYLLKIGNFSSHLFFYLKWRIKRMLLGLIIGSFSLLFSQVAVVIINDDILANTHEENTTWSTNLMDIAHVSNLTVTTVTNLFPIIISLASLFLLVFSLWKHLKKMRLSSSKGFQDANTNVHIRAIRTVISFLLLFTIFLLTFIISLWSSFRVQRKTIFLFCLALKILYPLSHSLILIWGNKKLTKAFLWFLRQLRFWLTEKK